MYTNSNGQLMKSPKTKVETMQGVSTINSTPLARQTGDCNRLSRFW